VSLGKIINGETALGQAPDVFAQAREDIKRLPPAEQERLLKGLENATRFATNAFSTACRQGPAAVQYIGRKE
jgi:hypothetical protein